MGDLEAIGHFDPGPWGARRVPAAERPNDSRDCWERDRSRVVHSSAFRRLPCANPPPRAPEPPGRETSSRRARGPRG